MMDDVTLIPNQTSSAEPEALAASPPSASAAPEEEQKPAYPSPAEMPTQEGPLGIRFDFNQGARVVLPNRTEGKWRIRLSDRDTGNTLFQSENQGALVRSSKQWFVRIGIEVWDVDAAGTANLVLSHDYDARDRDVLVLFPVGTLGDILAWFPYAARFAELHGCRLTCAMSAQLVPLLREAHPDITFVTHEELVEQDLSAQAYATYRLGLFFDDHAFIHQPADFRHVGLHRTAAISWASIRPSSHHASPCRTRPGRSRSPMSALPCKAPRSARSGTTRMAGGRSSPS